MAAWSGMEGFFSDSSLKSSFDVIECNPMNLRLITARDSPILTESSFDSHTKTCFFSPEIFQCNAFPPSLAVRSCLLDVALHADEASGHCVASHRSLCIAGVVLLTSACSHHCLPALLFDHFAIADWLPVAELCFERRGSQLNLWFLSTSHFWLGAHAQISADAPDRHLLWTIATLAVSLLSLFKRSLFHVFIMPRMSCPGCRPLLSGS